MSLNAIKYIIYPLKQSLNRQQATKDKKESNQCFFSVIFKLYFYVIGIIFMVKGTNSVSLLQLLGCFEIKWYTSASGLC